MIVIDDDLWSAVGDPTRRRLLDQLLSDGTGTATRRIKSGDRVRVDANAGIVTLLE